MLDEAISYLLRRAREGHLCVSASELSMPLPKKGIVHDGARVYLQKNWTYETTIAKHLHRLRNAAPTPLFDRTCFIEQLESEAQLLPEQKQALHRAFEAPLLVLSGGPGTGKTYTAAAFIRLLSSSLLPREKLHLVIAAPTGKAASHLQTVLLAQNVHCEAATLHRLLKLQPGENRLFSPRRIDADLILVDEASMIDVPLLAHLLEAVPSGSRIVFMGDPNQLPPVDQASVFADLATLFGCSLSQCMRTKDSSLAASLCKGDVALLHRHRLAWPFDELLIRRLFDKIRPICSPTKPDPEQCLAHYASLRVLNALRQGPFGTQELNARMNRLLDKAKWCALPILIKANDPHVQLYNGMTGVLLCHPAERPVAFFSGRPDPVYHLPPFEVAFCLSIHKSQGSEFREVLALFPAGSERFGRESLYTAITRAKETFAWVGEERTVAEMASRSSVTRSGLIERLSQQDAI